MLFQIYFITFLITFCVAMLKYYTVDSWFIVLAIFVATFFLEEILQAIREKLSGRGFKKYFSDTWNICDMIGIILFYAGFALRFWGIEWARIFLGLSLCGFILKILHFFTLHSTLGPQIVTIGRMVSIILTTLLIKL